MGIGNKTQAFMNGLSAFFCAMGTITTIPDVVAPEVRVPLSVFFWVCGIIGFALKEALGSAQQTT